MSSLSRFGCSDKISSIVISSAIIATTVATGNLKSLIQGTPPMRSGFEVIRLNSITQDYQILAYKSPYKNVN